MIVTALPAAAQVVTTTTTSSTTTTTTLLLCPPAQNPCTITGGSTVAAGTYDIRPNDLLVTQGVITVDTTGFLDIKAQNVVFQPGARLIAPGLPDAMSGGTVMLEADGTIDLQSAGTSKSRIDVTGFFAGGLISLTATGNVAVNASLVANATSRDGGGGEIDITSTMGDASITGDGLVAKGGDRFGGGAVFLEATLGQLTVDAPVTAANGDCSGCEIDLTAGTNVITTAKGDLDVSASNVGDGGGLDIEAINGDCIIDGQLLGDGAGNLTDGGGAGADISVVSDSGAVTIGARVEANGASPDGDAGTIDLEAITTLVQTGPMFAMSTGLGGGADVGWNSDGDVTVGSIDVSGDTNAGNLFATSGGLLTITGTVKGVLLNPALSLTPFGADCDFEGCQVTIPAATQISCLGPDTLRNTYVAGSTAVRIAGTITSTVGNQIDWRSAPPDLTGSTITPPPLVTQNPNLLCCGIGCTTTTTTTTSTTTSTTATTTTIGGTTSTTLASATTTSTTTSSTQTTSSSTSTTRTPTTTTSTSTTHATTTTSSAPVTSTTSTSASTSSTTSGSVPTTTSSRAPTSTTAPPATCLDTALGIDAVRCRLSTMTADVGSASQQDLGGKKLARKLALKIAKAQKLAGQDPSTTKRLQRASKQIQIFLTQLNKGVASGKVNSSLGTSLAMLASEAQNELAGLIAP